MGSLCPLFGSLMLVVSRCPYLSMWPSCLCLCWLLGVHEREAQRDVLKILLLYIVGSGCRRAPPKLNRMVEPNTWGRLVV